MLSVAKKTWQLLGDCKDIAVILLLSHWCCPQVKTSTVEDYVMVSTTLSKSNMNIAKSTAVLSGQNRVYN